VVDGAADAEYVDVELVLAATLLEVEEDVVGAAAEVDEGAAAVVEDDAALFAAALPASLAAEPASGDPAGNTTMLAFTPEGTVTTQKLAPPAPLAWSALETPPTPALEGSMEQGRPLQPSPSHSMLMPNVGVVPESEEPVNIGFHPIFTKVSPLATVFAPAT
jgi:hypothetical protein